MLGLKGTPSPPRELVRQVNDLFRHIQNAIGKHGSQDFDLNEPKPLYLSVRLPPDVSELAVISIEFPTFFKIENGELALRPVPVGEKGETQKGFQNRNFTDVRFCIVTGGSYSCN